MKKIVTRYVIKHGLPVSEYMRKVSWRLVIKVTPREVAIFIQSRFGELKISEARYEDLLSEADEHYSKHLNFLLKLFEM
jgi:intergrase/recombinase